MQARRPTRAGAVNCTLGAFRGRDGVDYTIVVQKQDGKTPAQLLDAAEAELTRLRAALAAYLLLPAPDGAVTCVSCQASARHGQAVQHREGCVLYEGPVHTTEASVHA